MKDVVLLNKVRGLKIQPGDYIEYVPEVGIYVYKNDDVIEGPGYFKKSTVSYEFSPEYIDQLYEREIVDEVGEDKVISRNPGIKVAVTSTDGLVRQMTQEFQKLRKDILDILQIF